MNHDLIVAHEGDGWWARCKCGWQKHNILESNADLEAVRHTLEVVKDERDCALTALEITGRDKDILKKREVELTTRVSVLEKELEEMRRILDETVSTKTGRHDNEARAALGKVHRLRIGPDGDYPEIGVVDVNLAKNTLASAFADRDMFRSKFQELVSCQAHLDALDYVLEKMVPLVNFETTRSDRIRSLFTPSEVVKIVIKSNDSQESIQLIMNRVKAERQ